MMTDWSCPHAERVLLAVQANLMVTGQTMCTRKEYIIQL